MVRFRFFVAAVTAVSLTIASPATAGWKLMPGRQTVNMMGMKITPLGDWNQASSRPGKQAQSWTRDGFGLNCLEMFAGVPEGQSLYKDRKRNPMPRFQSGILLPELADFFERSFRAQNGITDFTVVEAVPATFGGHRGLRVRYQFSLPKDDLVREGEVRLAVIDRKLYAANFYAPQLHYFPDGLAEANAIMDGIRL